jgi:hypothetical protein
MKKEEEEKRGKRAGERRRRGAPSGLWSARSSSDVKE